MSITRMLFCNKTIKFFRMKKFTLLFSTLFTLVLLTSCGPSSVKGKWSAEDKTNSKATFVAEMKKGQAENPILTDDLINKVADCTIGKLEAEFAFKDLGNKENEAKIGAISTECMTQNLPAALTPSPEAAPADTTKAAPAN
jgi:hypothetical protein